MALPKIDALTEELAIKSNDELKQMALLHKADPYVFPLIVAEDMRRKKIRAANAGAQYTPQPKVVDKEISAMGATPMPEDVGIAQLPAPNMARMADGGIAGYDEGGMVSNYPPGEVVMRMAAGGVAHFDKGGRSKQDIMSMVLEAAERYGIDPDVAVRLVKAESGFNPDAVSPKKAVGLTQLMADTAKDMGISPEDRKDPAKNLDAGFKYLRKQLDKYGDYGPALAAFNWGPTNVDKHLTKHEGRINPNGLPKETADYLTKIMPGSVAQAATPTAPQALPADKAAPPPAPAPQKRSQFEAIADAARGVVGAGETALQYGTGLLAIPTAGAYAQYRRAAYGDDPEKVFREAAGSVTYQPRTEAGQEVSERVGRTLEDLKIPGYMPGVGPRPPKTKAGPAAADLAAIAAEREAQAATPRLAGPTTDTTMVQKPGQAPVKDGNLVRKQLEDIESARAYRQAATEAQQREGLGGIADEQARLLAQAQEAQRARLVGAGATVPGQVVGAGGAGGADTGGGVPSVAPENYDPIDAAYRKGATPEEKKEVGTQMVKEATAEAEKTGGIASLFENPVFLFGLRLMGESGPNFLQNVGRAGSGTAADMAALRKSKLEERKAATEEKYYGALSKRAEALAKTEGLTGSTQLAYYLGKGDTTEERVSSGYATIQAAEAQMKQLGLDEKTQEAYWKFVTEQVKQGEKPTAPRAWAEQNRQVTALRRAPPAIDTTTNIRP